MRHAVGTSLFALFALGAGTTLSHATTGLVDWSVAGLFVAGGAAGSWLGLRAGAPIGRGAIEAVLALLILAAAAFLPRRAFA
jgi:uncharacterized membrane protein YfcA